MSNIDVLIVGAGPVGLTLAAECRRHGVDFRIIEKLPAPSDKSKALGVWSGTIECMAAMGVADEFLAKSMPAHGIMFYDSGTFINRTSLHEGLESVYPQPFLLPQCWTEEILATHLAQAGVAIERSVALTGMKNIPSGVEATLTRADGTTESVTAKWLASCEGAHSVARHHLPITFEGVTVDSAFVLCDAKVKGDLPADNLVVNWGPAGVCVFFPIKKDVFRLFTLRSDLTNHEPPTLDEINSYLGANGLGRITMHDPEWLAYFSVNERYASRARVGRVFLLGDSAHIHSPAGGQGMNTGMQDAFNLAWKLALLARGSGDSEALAESFHAERHPVAKSLIEKTSKLLHFGMANNAFLRIAKDIALKLVFQSRFIQSKLSGEFSELHICYPESPLVIPDEAAWPNSGGFEPGSKPRDAALRDPVTDAPVSLWRQFLTTKHTLVVFSGKRPSDGASATMGDIAATVKPHGDAIQVVIVWAAEKAPLNRPAGATLYLDPTGTAHDRYGVDQAGWYLVRPDQYLAARAPTLKTDALHAYLKKVVA